MGNCILLLFFFLSSFTSLVLTASDKTWFARANWQASNPWVMLLSGTAISLLVFSCIIMHHNGWLIWLPAHSAQTWRRWVELCACVPVSVSVCVHRQNGLIAGSGTLSHRCPVSFLRPSRHHQCWRQIGFSQKICVYACFSSAHLCALMRMLLLLVLEADKHNGQQQQPMLPLCFPARLYAD